MSMISMMMMMMMMMIFDKNSSKRMSEWGNEWLIDGVALVSSLATTESYIAGGGELPQGNEINRWNIRQTNTAKLPRYTIPQSLDDNSILLNAEMAILLPSSKWMGKCYLVYIG